MKLNSTETTADFATIKDAFDFLNAKLFDNELPGVIFTYQRKANSFGHFHFERFNSRSGEQRASEINLNPDGFVGRDDKEILATLVHEMVHEWEYLFEIETRKAYHGKEWGEKMEAIGLMPSSTGEPNGKKTGQKMHHYIIEDGPFDQYVSAFLTRHKLLWESAPLTEKEKKEKKKSSKKKYNCPTCETSVWGKPDLNLACGDCVCPLIMEPDEDEG